MTFLKNIIRSILLPLIEILLLIVLLEGLCSFTLVFAFYGNPKGGRVVQYDELLGWVSKPNLQKRDMYGPGVYLRTNAQSFRNSEVFSAEVPSGKLRILCSGDSYTYGLNVDNDHTWPAQLGAMDWRLQVLNMAQGGYGIDQSYLRYVRDGLKLDHQFHLFAFIMDDFIRGQHTRFQNVYAKPLLVLEEGKIKVKNVPVPTSYLLERALRKSRELRSFELVRSFIRKFVPPRDFYSGSGYQDIKALSLSIFEDLARSIKQKKGTLVLIFLPIERDYYRDDSDALRAWLKGEMNSRGILFVDLVEELRKLSIPDYKNFFNGHYTVAGNRFVAQYLYNTLQAHYLNRNP